jgi:YQGE family putative transporter
MPARRSAGAEEAAEKAVLLNNPIEPQVVDTIARIEGHSEYAYFFNREFGLFAGRFLGCVLFLAIVHWGSEVAALRFALPVVALLQMLSIPVASRISRELKESVCEGSELELA